MLAPMGHYLKWQRYIYIAFWYKVWSSCGLGLQSTNYSCLLPSVAERSAIFWCTGTAYERAVVPSHAALAQQSQFFIHHAWSNTHLCSALTNITFLSVYSINWSSRRSWLPLWSSQSEYPDYLGKLIPFIRYISKVLKYTPAT